MEILKGVPYFGENTIEIERNIKNKKVDTTKIYSSLHKLIQDEKSDSNVIVIENNKGVWLSYIRDIRFNYRDKKVFIPYFEYDIHDIDSSCIYNNNKGHLLVDDNTVHIRYNYKLFNIELSIMNNSFIIYNFDTDKKYRVVFKTYYDKQNFNIKELYDKYLHSCIRDEDFTIFKHIEGYHLITKRFENIRNKEKELRLEYGLKDYSDETYDTELNYRDVRNYSIEQFIINYGLIELNKPKWERVLDFESLLFCITNSEAIPDDKDLNFKSKWGDLGKTKSFIKYGDTIKLIIKDYWIYGNTIGKKYTWSRNK